MTELSASETHPRRPPGRDDRARAEVNGGAVVDVFRRWQGDAAFDDEFAGTVATASGLPEPPEAAA